MKFDCKEISITDEAFACTVTFSEKEDNGYSGAEQSINEIMSSIGQYMMLQRTYAEDEFESDYLYIETSDPDKCGELKDFSIHLYPTHLLMTYEEEIFDIILHTNNQKFEKLKKALALFTNENGPLIVHNNTA